LFDGEQQGLLEKWAGSLEMILREEAAEALRIIRILRRPEGVRG